MCKKRQSAETEFTFFCLYTGSPGDGGTCSQEFPSPGELHDFCMLRITDSAADLADSALLSTTSEALSAQHYNLLKGDTFA